ncbi:MAG: hypothetical protein PHY90_09985 [Desulfitobacteriaceae bacterium]|nr:hypothetical protein [Desulfitobacteriaceae bacterium]
MKETSRTERGFSGPVSGKGCNVCLEDSEDLRYGLASVAEQGEDNVLDKSKRSLTRLFEPKRKKS